MTTAMKQALTEYGQTAKKNGWKSAEPLIEAGKKKFGKDFQKWAHALGIMLRAQELLNQ